MSEQTIDVAMPSAKDDAEKAPKEGVLAQRSTENIKPWQPGQSGNPLGRPKRPETQVLALIAAQVPGQMIVDALLELIGHSSWRAREAGIKLYLSYMIGMPIQRSVTASTKLESILARVNELSDDEFADVEQKLREG